MSTRSNTNTNANNASFLEKWLALFALLLRIFLWPLRVVSNLIFTGSDLDGLSDAVTAKAAQQFVSHLQHLASQQTTPNSTLSESTTASSATTIAAIDAAWNSTTGFSATQQQAVQSQSLLFVYLHSPLHRQADSFCKSVLLHPTLLQWLSQHGVQAVGVSIHTGQGAHLASLLQVTSFPAIALLHPRTTTSMSLIMRVQGPLLLKHSSMDQFLPHLQAALHRQLAAVSEQETVRLQRQQEAELRRQQDEEYQETLAQDRERARLQQQEQELQRVTLRQEQEEAQRVEEEAQAELAKAMSLVKPEPASGGTMVRFVLPSGTKLNRRFGSDETMAALRAFLRLQFTEKDIEMGRIGLSTNFPRKSYNDEDDQTTLEELGLSPQAVLMVQDLDA